MKTKQFILLIIFSFFSFQISIANPYNINQNDVINLTNEYVDNMIETWNLVSTVTNKPVIVNYSIGTESGYDFVKINSVDDSGVVTNLLTLSGTKSGTISTLVPNGKVQIVFISDGSVSYNSDPSIYTGVNVSFSVDNSTIIDGNTLVTGNLQTSGNGLINGKLGIGLNNPTKKLEIYEGIGGRFSFSAANCTSGYEIAQTVDNTGYKINVGSAIRDYRISMYGSDKLTIQNGGNVGIGTSTPYGILDVTGPVGGFAVCGTNIDPYYSNKIAPFQNSNKLILGWNYSGARGEQAFITNSNPALAGGFSFYNFPFNSNSATHLMTIGSNGNVGIGTSTPQAKLESVTGVNALPATSGTSQSGAALRLRGGNNAVLDFGMNSTNTWIQATDVSDLSSKYNISLNPNGGNVGIGTTNPQNMLDVKGTIRAMEIKVESVDKFADFVFDPDYQLPTLSQVNSYIKANKHLQNIPSAAEVKENGMSLVDMQVKLLQKVEELTLYIIQQQKEIDLLKQSKR